MYFQQILQGISSNLMDSNLFQLKSNTFCKTYRWMLVTWGFLLTHLQPSVRLFLGIPDRQFNLGHWSYLFKMWTQQQLRDLTTEKVIEEHLALFQIKEYYKRQNVNPPGELLVDLELFNDEIKARFEFIKIILNCITAEFMACIASSMI